MDEQAEERWRAVRERDGAATGFLFGVLTTGIYCRPGCPARTPLRDNVAFFETIAAARAAGLRPCRRCRPDDGGLPPWFEEACTALAAPGARVAEVAERCEVSRSTLHRSFREVLGLAPSDFRRALGGARLRSALERGGSVLDACFAAGFGSASAAYASSARQLGVAPGAVRDRGAQLELRYATGDSELGTLVAAATADGLCLLEFLDGEGTPEDAVRERFPLARIEAADRRASALLAEAIAAVDAPERGRGLPRDVRGTAFQQQVWDALSTVGAGERISYSGLAARIGRPEATRAVARAVGQNPLAVLVPCHRVIGRDGSLTGYRWGVERKRRLLEREARVASVPEGPEPKKA